MNDYVNNSDAARRSRKTETNPVDVTDRKSIAHGSTQHSGAMNKFLDIFVKKNLGESIRDAVTNRFYPMVIDGIYNTIEDALGMMFYGDRYIPPKRSYNYDSHGDKRHRDDDYIDYTPRGRERQRRHSREIERAEEGYREMKQYARISFETEDEVLDVLDALWDVIDQKGYVTVAKYFEYADISTKNYTLNEWGWTSLRNVHPRMLRNGRWKIDLPQPIAIDTHSQY